jgi:uncharacterized membrane protein
MVIIRKKAFISQLQANSMDERILLMGFGLILIGIAVIVLGSALGSKGKSGSSSSTSSGFAVGGFIGPIPFGWTTEKPLLYVVIAISAIAMLLLYIFGRITS